MNEQIKAIRAEIERRIKEYDAIIESQPDSNRSERDAWKWAEDKSLLSFIDSLPEEKPSEDLEEAAEDCVWKSIDNNDQTLVPKFIPLLLSLFISGAYWQKEQMMNEWLQDRDGCFWDGVAEGKKAMEKQMMKDAVEGIIGIVGFHNAVYTKEPEMTKKIDELKKGDKVRIIIVKEDKR